MQAFGVYTPQKFNEFFHSEAQIEGQNLFFFWIFKIYFRMLSTLPSTLN